MMPPTDRRVRILGGLLLGIVILVAVGFVSETARDVLLIAFLVGGAVGLGVYLARTGRRT